MAIRIRKPSSKALSSQPPGHRSTLASVKRCLRATSWPELVNPWHHQCQRARALVLLVTSLGCCYKRLLTSFLLQILQMNLAKPSSGATGTLATLLRLSARQSQRFHRKECSTMCGRHITATNPAKPFLRIDFVYLVNILKWSTTQIHRRCIYDGLGRGKAWINIRKGSQTKLLITKICYDPWIDMIWSQPQ